MLYACSFRWRIESCYYELKEFWSFEQYMLRSARGFCTLLNLMTVAYATARILPLRVPALASVAGSSPQVALQFIGDKIRTELFSRDLTSWVKTQRIQPDLCATIIQVLQEYTQAA